jgi:hypothetical protein
MILDDETFLGAEQDIWWPCINGLTTIVLDFDEMKIVSVKTRLNTSKETISKIRIIMTGAYNNCAYVQQKSIAKLNFNRMIQGVVDAYSCKSLTTTIIFDYTNAHATCAPTIHIDIGDLSITTSNPR